MVQFVPTGHTLALLSIVAMLVESCVAWSWGRGVFPWGSLVSQPPGPCPPGPRPCPGGIAPTLGPRPPTLGQP
ncbi:hypothetical protein PTTG_26225 [Puccinia triticina 1-1 BBBD Race 1]|uniref:Secreted protein n=1 Tax=Puccinia triticina (isolate 1-1 / race 1 (BBBD)) TaxID=630390 RepID=A0A180GXK2_PUCT1|nr:hypothetical protein PTTG_26225 [Puccinia triticina 1-1 BBBD Race 1]